MRGSLGSPNSFFELSQIVAIKTTKKVLGATATSSLLVLTGEPVTRIHDHAADVGVVNQTTLIVEQVDRCHPRLAETFDLCHF